MKEAIEDLHPKVNQLIYDLGWELTPIQKAALPDLLVGKDRLMVAPTGSGKTESAILPLVSRCLTENWDSLSILYITPLRALNRDIDRRLSKMLVPLGLTVGLRHGDTPQNERVKQSKKPPNLLVTTPETMQIMLLGSRLRQHLAGVKAIILDEVHDMAGSERGSQLLVGLQRIQDYCPDKIQVVGLSATVGNPDEVAKWFSGEGRAIIGPAPRETRVLVHKEPVASEDETLSVEWRVSSDSIAAFRRLSKKLSEDAPALVFVNSRNTAETVAQRLIELSPELNIGIHHGSLAAETRREVEESLRKGELHGLICTSSLELGIDVGSIKKVHQLQSPRSVESLLQRVGRAEHYLGGTGAGEILAWEIDGISECAVIARKAMAGEIGEVEWRTNPRIVAANQFLQMSIEKGVCPLKKATDIIEKTSIFDDWHHDKTLSILRVLDDRWLIRLIEDPKNSDPTLWNKKLWKELAIRIGDDFPAERPSWENEHSDLDKKKWLKKMIKILPDSLKDGWFSPAGRLGQNRMNHISMIPDKTSYRVRDAVTRKTLGSVDEAFVLSLNDDSEDSLGQTRRFVMAGRTWEIIDADPEQEELLVGPVKESGTAPVWSGELPPVPRNIAEEVGKLRRITAVSIGAMAEDNSKKNLSDYPLSESARDVLISTVSDHLEATGEIPDGQTMTIEERKGTIVLNTCKGSKINETLAHFIQAMGSMREGKMGRTVIDPYRIAFQIPGATPTDIIDWLTQTPAAAIPSILRMTIPNSRTVRWRVVQVAKKMGVLKKGVDPRKVNLNGLMKRYKGTPVVEEALDKLFHERMDIDGTIDTLKMIQDNEIKLIQTPPGPLGISPKAEKDLLLPSWTDKELRERLELRLINERVSLICINCHNNARKRVAKLEKKILPCSLCGGTMLACSPERMENRLKEMIESKDSRIRGKVMKNAELIKTHGLDGIICLMGRGVGEETATRILRGHIAGDRMSLLRSIHDAELKYASTRRYWS
ncbi:MAG: ATP-dependent Lhr-like helicase [Candidatus Thalassarchaeaceae archaeon]|jgi:ATP-dependent Lhr-like helicase